MSTPSTPQEKSPKRKPRPLLHMKSYSADPGGSSPCSTPRSTTSWTDRHKNLANTTHPVYDPVHPPEVTFKLLQVTVTVVTTGAYSEGVNQVIGSTTAQMMPYFVCSAYLIITSVILISYVLGHKMPEILVRIFNTLGGVLCLAAGLTALQNWRIHALAYDENLSEENLAKKQYQAAFLLTTGVLCLVNTALYLADVGWSIHKSLVLHSASMDMT